MMYDEYTRRLDKLEKRFNDLVTLSNFANVALGFQRVAFADLPTAANSQKIYYVTNGCKSGEASGAGTGVLAIDDEIATVATWVRVDDPTQAVTV